MLGAQKFWAVLWAFVSYYMIPFLCGVMYREWVAPTLYRCVRVAFVRVSDVLESVWPTVRVCRRLDRAMRFGHTGLIYLRAVRAQRLRYWFRMFIVPRSPDTADVEENPGPTFLEGPRLIPSRSENRVADPGPFLSQRSFIAQGVFDGYLADCVRSTYLALPSVSRLTFGHVLPLVGCLAYASRFVAEDGWARSRPYWLCTHCDREFSPVGDTSILSRNHEQSPVLEVSIDWLPHALGAVAHVCRTGTAVLARVSVYNLVDAACMDDVAPTSFIHSAYRSIAVVHYHAQNDTALRDSVLVRHALGKFYSELMTEHRRQAGLEPWVVPYVFCLARDSEQCDIELNPGPSVSDVGPLDGVKECAQLNRRGSQSGSLLGKMLLVPCVFSTISPCRGGAYGDGSVGSPCHPARASDICHVGSEGLQCLSPLGCFRQVSDTLPLPGKMNAGLKMVKMRVGEMPCLLVVTSCATCVPAVLGAWGFLGIESDSRKTHWSSVQVGLSGSRMSVLGPGCLRFEYCAVIVNRTCYSYDDVGIDLLIFLPGMVIAPNYPSVCSVQAFSVDPGAVDHVELSTCPPRFGVQDDFEEAICIRLTRETVYLLYYKTGLNRSPSAVLAISTLFIPIIEGGPDPHVLSNHSVIASGYRVLRPLLRGSSEGLLRSFADESLVLGLDVATVQSRWVVPGEGHTLSSNLIGFDRHVSGSLLPRDKTIVPLKIIETEVRVMACPLVALSCATRAPTIPNMWSFVDIWNDFSQVYWPNVQANLSGGCMSTVKLGGFYSEHRAVIVNGVRDSYSETWMGLLIFRLEMTITPGCLLVCSMQTLATDVVAVGRVDLAARPLRFGGQHDLDEVACICVVTIPIHLSYCRTHLSCGPSAAFATSPSIFLNMGSEFDLHVLPKHFVTTSDNCSVLVLLREPAEGLFRSLAVKPLVLGLDVTTGQGREIALSDGHTTLPSFVDFDRLDVFICSKVMATSFRFSKGFAAVAGGVTACLTMASRVFIGPTRQWFEMVGDGISTLFYFT